MRKTFYDLLDNMEFDIFEETQSLLYLFTEEKDWYNNSWCSAASYIDETCFRKLKMRGTTLSVFDFMKKLGIAKASSDINDLFVMCEFFHHLFLTIPIFTDQYLQKIKEIINENISVILEKTNHKFATINETDIIIEDKKEVTLAAELVSDPNISLDILEYNHFALKGNLEKKKKILSSIGLYLEPTLNDKTVQEYGYQQLASDARFLLNNLHIRHNNKEGTKANDYVIGLKDSALEEWYDKTYNILISVIILQANSKTHEDINNLKKNYKFKN